MKKALLMQRVRHPYYQALEKEQVGTFVGCCTADSQTDAGRYQLYNNGSLVLFYTPFLLLTFNFTSGCLCLRCRVEDEGGGGRTLEHDLDKLKEAMYGLDSDLTPHSIILVLVVVSPVSSAASASFVYIFTYR